MGGRYELMLRPVMKLSSHGPHYLIYCRKPMSYDTVAATHRVRTSFFLFKPFLWIFYAFCTTLMPPSIAGLDSSVSLAKAFSSHSLNIQLPYFASPMALAADVLIISMTAGFSASSGYGSVKQSLPPPKLFKISAHIGAILAYSFETFWDWVMFFTTEESL